MDILRELGKDVIAREIPEFGAGDTVRVYVKIVEKAPVGKKSKKTKAQEAERVRPQMFEGVVLRRRSSGVSSTFAVRKISYGIGVERVFPLYSPRIEKIEVIRKGRVRRCKLYYLRELRGKAARLKEVRPDRIDD